MIKKLTAILFCMCLGVVIFNYDKVAAKVAKHLPSKIDNVLAVEYLPNKFWLHRVNSVEKQKEFSDKYAGLEFDIIFHSDKMAFENSHDADDFRKYNLEEQFKTYQNLGKKNGLWLDFKNLSNNNKEDALFVLEGLLAKYKIDKKLVWVESQNWKSLKTFRDAGYRTSYYFPYYNFKKIKQAEITEIKEKTEMIASSGNVDAISFYGGYYGFIKTLELPPRITLLSWLNGQEWSEILLLKKYAEIRNDDRVKVILVKDLGKHHR